MCLSFRSRWTRHRELFNSEAQDTKHDQQQLDQYWGNHLNGWQIGYSKVSTRHFWTESFEDIRHQRSRRRMPYVDQILHMKFCYLSFENVSHISYNELRLTWILENEIRRRPMSTSVTPFTPLIISLFGTTFDLIPDSRGYVGATTARSYTQKISISLHNGNWDRIFERISKIHLKLDFFNKSKQKTKILRFELRSTWILKNEIRRRPLSALVGFFVNFILVNL